MVTASEEYWQPITLDNAVRSTCLNCPPKPSMMPRWLDPGFGFVELLCDGKPIAGGERASVRTIVKWRGMAHADPDHEWCVEYEAPMTAVRYTRQPNGRWIATHRGMGFA